MSGREPLQIQSGSRCLLVATPAPAHASQQEPTTRKTRGAADRCRRQNHDNLPSRTDGALNGRPGLYFRAAVRRRKGSPLGQLVVVSNRARRVRRGIQRSGSLGDRVRGCHWNNELERRIILLGWSGIKLDRRHTSRPINPTRHLTLLFCAHGVYCGNGRMGTIFGPIRLLSQGSSAVSRHAQ